MSDTPDTLEAFRHFREKMNAAIHEAGNTSINRLFALDSRVYENGAPPVKTKELLASSPRWCGAATTASPTT